MSLRILESFQERRARDRDGYHANQYVWVFRRFLVGLPAFLALLPLLLTLTRQSILFVELTLPEVHGILHHRLVTGLFTADNRHQSQPVRVAVAILHRHLVGIGRRDRHDAAEHGHVHRDRHTHQ